MSGALAEPRICENCRWWDNSTELALAEPGTTGACRVAAPVADDRTGKARWPYTEYTDWCGCYVATPPVAAAADEQGAAR